MGEAVGLGRLCKDIFPAPSQRQECEQDRGKEGGAPVQRCAQLQKQNMEKAAWKWGGESHDSDEKSWTKWMWRQIWAKSKEYSREWWESQWKARERCRLLFFSFLNNRCVFLLYLVRRRLLGFGSLGLLFKSWTVHSVCLCRPPGV